MLFFLNVSQIDEAEWLKQKVFVGGDAMDVEEAETDSGFFFSFIPIFIQNFLVSCVVAVVVLFFLLCLRVMSLQWIEI